MTKTRVLALIFFVTLISFSSCRKKPEKIGNDLQPSNSLISVSFSDQQDIVSSTFKMPALNTKQVGYSFIGNMNDPIFGNSNFDFYTQFSLSTSSLSWGENAIADSVVLNMAYNGYYGDTLDKQLTLRVFELAEPMYDNTDSTYKSNMTLQCETNELANLTFVPRPLTPMDTTIDRGVLKVNIDNSLAEKLIANGPYESNSVFKEAFKGLHLVCDKNDIAASVVSFNLTHSYSYLRVYYHNDTDTLKYDFTVTSSDVRFNHYTHDYSTVANPVVFNDTTNKAALFVQGAAGTRVWLKFPNLQEWANSLDNNIAINEAKLILNGVEEDTTITNMYSPPSRLIVTGAKFDTDTTYLLLSDQYVGSEYYGGYYDKTDNKIWFRITEYIQNIIQNGNYSTTTNGLLLYVDQGALVPHRWAFHGPQSDSLDKRIRLEIVYSLIND